jgi:hypothetical protein
MTGPPKRAAPTATIGTIALAVGAVGGGGTATLRALRRPVVEEL